MKVEIKTCDRPLISIASSRISAGASGNTRMQCYKMAFFQMDSPLLAHAANVTSQCGEDGLIAHIMSVIKPRERYCVEFGAWDGRHWSNCNNLVTHAGWRGLMIEANAERFAELRETYAALPEVTALNRFVDFEGPNSLDNILRAHGAPTEFGLLSIDVDGNDYHIWESLASYKPEVVVVEVNPTVPLDVVFVQDKSFEVNQGASMLAMILLGKQKGYELAVATPWNGIFVRSDKYPLLGIKDNSIYKLFEPMQDGRIFQGYDGAIHVIGMNELVWRGTPLSSEDFQVLPKEKRVYNDAQRK